MANIAQRYRPMDTDQNKENQQIVLEYHDFLNDGTDKMVYSRKIDDLIEQEGCRLVVNLNDLRKSNPVRCSSLLKNSLNEINCFHTALKRVISVHNPNYGNSKDFLIGLSGSFGARHVSPRTLNARLLGGMVCIEGIVTKCSLVRPKIVRSVHYSPKTGKTIERRYNDATGSTDATSRTAYPTKDDEGNPLETEYGLCVFKDHQMFTIQELPEKAPPGQLPRSVEVICEDDLVDECKPGDRVLVVGSYRVVSGKIQGFFTGNFKTVILANFITQQTQDQAPVYSSKDIKTIRQYSRQDDIFEMLSKSVAPSIYGHEYVKQAILCLLLGGQEKILPNGTRLRGDVNILLIGDPSVAKSQMLRFVLQIANVAVATTGRGSTGVGLTAAVTSDETGERRLEAGAMVLADRGVVCIDEFDKMAEEDRTAIHEVMEQGRVTISKAGIHAKLNARCSVLAAANPVYGRYDPYKSPMDNIGMQDSLLSRFDLIFVMIDKADAELDLTLADHVVRMHRYRTPGEIDGEPSRLNTGVEWLSTAAVERDVAENEQIYEKYDPLLHGSRNKHEKVFCREFLRKYIMIAKLSNPTLTQEACTLIAEKYSMLRSQEKLGETNARTQPVTARALETLIRLATAHAKARLAKKVELKDAAAAVGMVEYAYFNKVEKRQRKKRLADEPEEPQANGDENDVEINGVRASKKVRAEPDDDDAMDPDDPYNFAETSQRSERTLRPRGPAGAASGSAPLKVTLSGEKFRAFKKLVSEVFQKQHVTTLPVEEVVSYVGDYSNEFLFTRNEINAGFADMVAADQIVMADDQIFLAS
ncbi:DNA replication licensing factor Mcm3 [Hypsibius exemplaris]|uniref:DNA replication licensing factor MCM3 n=1 Tax=Hypsibius exemplaris TaxID=2072580 RepID=A0A9X6NE72_HYPEX|nr:DNA replication licensing factor Mcm3 [Hypsibius exemplaris]